MKHVLVTITNSPDDFGGGVFTWIKRITQGLPAHGWRVTVVTHALDEPRLETWLKQDADITLKPMFGRYARLCDIDAALADFLKDALPDVVLINSSYWMIPTLQRLKRQGSHVRIVGACHADSNAYYDGLAFYRDCFDHVVSISELCRRRLVDLGYSTKRVSVVAPGVPCAERWSRPTRQGQLRLAYVGRLVQQQKRILDFVELVRSLNESQIDYRLDFYGVGPDEGQLREGIQALDRQGRVSFHGWVPADKVMTDVWPNTDVFLLLSEYEGLSGAMLEAMGSGVVPVVSHVASGIEEAIHEGETGYTFPIGDLQACARLIVSLDRDRALLTTLSRQAWRLAHQNFSVQSQIPRLAAILDNTFERPAQMNATRYMGVTAHPLVRLVPGWAIVSARRVFQRGNPRNQGYTTYP